MKTKILLLFILCFNLSKAQVNIDSLKDVAFKPILQEYVVKVNDFTKQIKASQDPNEIKTLALQIRDVSDDMKRMANKFYGYGSIGPEAKVTALGEVYLVPETEYGTKPDVSYTLESIRISANRMRLYCKRNPNKFATNLVDLESDLKKL